MSSTHPTARTLRHLSDPSLELQENVVKDFVLREIPSGYNLWTIRFTPKWAEKISSESLECHNDILDYLGKREKDHEFVVVTKELKDDDIHYHLFIASHSLANNSSVHSEIKKYLPAAKGNQHKAIHLVRTKRERQKPPLHHSLMYVCKDRRVVYSSGIPPLVLDFASRTGSQYKFKKSKVPSSLYLKIIEKYDLTQYHQGDAVINAIVNYCKLTDRKMPQPHSMKQLCHNIKFHLCPKYAARFLTSYTDFYDNLENNLPQQF